MIAEMLFLVPGLIFIVIGDRGNGIGALILFPIVMSLAFFAAYRGDAIGLLWKKLATANGWQYEKAWDCNKEKWLMVNRGDQDLNRTGKSATNLVYGTLETRPFKIFGLEFAPGNNRYWYTVFAFTFDGESPHVYLNNKSNSYGAGDVGTKIPLNEEFDKVFTLIAPKQYEIEGLQIFTPDIMAYLLENKFPYDIEFIGHEMFIFVDGQLTSFEAIRDTLNRMLLVRDLFMHNVSRLSFSEIGDTPHTL